MHGNISELCSNRFFKNTGTFIPGGGNHVCRGGSWFAELKRCQSAYRGLGGIRCDVVGFRVIFTGEVDDDKKILEITLPTDADEVSIDPEQKPDIEPDTHVTITGVVRDEAGIPIDGTDMHILPAGDWLLRLYPKGRFETVRFYQNSDTPVNKYYFMVRHTQRNLAIVTEVEEDVNVFDIKLKPGAILTGKVVDAYGKGIQGTKITTIMQDPNWQRPLPLLPFRMEVDEEGKFEVRALPLGHKYRVIANAMGYRLKEFEVSSNNPPNNRIDIDPIVLPRGKFTVSGVVVDTKGKPVANAWVYCTGENQVGINTHTDEKGRFTAHGIFEGPVQITAAIKGHGDISAYGSTYGGTRTRAGAKDVKIWLRHKATYGRQR